MHSNAGFPHFFHCPHPFLLHYHALAPHSPWLCVPLHLCTLCCFSPAGLSLVYNGSSKVKSAEMLISKALAHSALEIRILVHYTRLLAEQSAVTRKHNAGAKGSDLEL